MASAYEQRPARSCPALSVPERTLAHGGPPIPLGLEFPGYEQRPAGSYPLGASPLRTLARGGLPVPLALTFPAGEQRPQRSYPLGSHPLWDLARWGVVEIVVPPVGGGGASAGGIRIDWRRDESNERDDAADEEDFIHMLALIAPYL